MAETMDGCLQVAVTTRRIADQVLTIAENRLTLVTVEVQEERNRLLHALVLVLGIAGCGLLCGIAITAAIVLQGWAWSPLGVLLILAAGYASVAAALSWLLTRHLRQWSPFAATLDQVRKDRVCLADLRA
ncbi:MAG TPA: hypothetical protein DCS97_13445 [Planctomycetes bacterium]|nr:hypothetical protein [Planctomycetota bacterium]